MNDRIKGKTKECKKNLIYKDDTITLQLPDGIWTLHLTATKDDSYSIIQDEPKEFSIQLQPNYRLVIATIDLQSWKRKK